MTEQEWQECSDPRRMLEFLEDSPADKRFWLFGAACCRRLLWKVLAQDTSEIADQSRKAVELFERFIEGNATADQVEDLPFDRLHPAVVALCCDTEKPGTSLWADSLLITVVGEIRSHPSELNAQADLLRCFLGTLPFRPVPQDQVWLTPTIRTVEKESGMRRPSMAFWR